MKNQTTKSILTHFGQRLTWSMLVIVLVIQSCNSPKPEEDSQKINSEELITINSDIDLSTYKVGYCTPSLNAPFYVALSNSVEKQAKAYGMKFSSADGQADISKQITAIEDLVASGINILVVNPLDAKALVNTITSVSKRGIPVFIVDSYIDPKAEYISAIQADNQGNGFMIGEWVAEKFGENEVKAALISGSQGNPIGQKKRLGFVMGFAEGQLRSNGHTELSIVSQGWGQWSNNGGLTAMEDILIAHPDINLLVAENDAMGMGALKAINEAGKSDEITVVGFDGQKEAYEFIQKGDFNATALNSPSELGRLAIESVVKYLNGDKSLDKVTYTKAAIITADNVDDYYDPKAIF